MRWDLSPAQQAVQAAHACIEAARHSLSPPDEHPHLVLLGVPDELRLTHALARLRALDVPCYPFCEPDLGGELTALATAPLRGAARAWFRRYPCLTGVARLQDAADAGAG